MSLINQQYYDKDDIDALFDDLGLFIDDDGTLKIVLTNNNNVYVGSLYALKSEIPEKISDLTDDSNFVEKSNTKGLLKNDGSVDTNTYLSSVALADYVQYSTLNNYLQKSQTSYKGKNVVVDGTSGNISFEDKNNHSHSNYLTSSDITGKLDTAQTSHKGENVVVDATSGQITFEAKNNHTHDGLIDSTWTTLTVNSNFYNYTENSQVVLPLQYRKIGNIVEIIGLVGLNANLSSGQWTIGTLPTGVRPTKEISFVAELHNNSNLWTCIIKTNGDITFNRLRDINSSVDVTIQYANSSETVSLAKATSYVTGKQWVDVLKINAMFIV